MDADLDLLLTAVFCTADDLLPERVDHNARRQLTDAEIVTLAVAQVLLDKPSDRRFLRVARRRLVGLFPTIPTQSAYFKRRAKLGEAIDWLCGVFAAQSPGSRDEIVLVDSTPLECGRSVETTRRSRLSEVCGYGYSRSHSRWFWGMRLHLAAAPDGTPRRAVIVAADRPEREVAQTLLLPGLVQPGIVVLTDKGYAGREFAAAIAADGGCVLRPARRDEPDHGVPLSSLRQRIESIFWTLKDVLSLERHGARTPEGLRVRIGVRLLALAAAISLNHQLHRPSRSLVDYTA